MDFGQVLTAMVTSFEANGEVDLEATSMLVEHLIANGSDGLVVAGTTGESPTLTKEEKLNLFTCVVKAAGGRVPVIAGTGSNNTYESIALTKEAEKVGVDGIMLVAPYYNKPSQEGLVQHFQAIAQETTLPIMLYNIPGRSVVNMSVETVVTLSKIDNIVAIKDASGNLNESAAIIRETADDFSLYSGDDGMTLPILAIGGKGVVSVASHIIGNEMQEMVYYYRQGYVQKSAAMHRELLPIMNALFRAPSPSPVKAALNLAGIPVGGVRLPMVPLNEQEMYELQQVLPVNERKAIV
ncbi:4-hydroxy-tetrahydrodipicolinate synthase [Virgibacillus dakarensis]|uniref:4-hydroxy-tetrahydrodipicolinate synthase n=1 Tax=Lentibacillus populi TaxID=1827502 RepID=A0A9W5U1J6_9BACI|nr:MULTISPECIES: 4-hydroxy-tetrahydrodipicolinate synthase [Bacillaceae]MBT2216456.1 4-hydroxy-tetrahydrodipicolinate synthase [Virgibacillus dakarensis]MTW85849.1 4-hydroxy-tetrahydrodipicolinate synthase [Virgibacillus dakarensis]GGB60000.1 4-hydroxy-tetrahydrodipicolinate synthase [Lentibacillus populi]